MSHLRYISFVALLLLTAAVLGLYCTKNPTTSKSPVAPGPDTIPHIIGRYSGSAIIDNYVANTRKTIYANVEIDSSTSTFHGCGCAYVISIGETGSGTRQQYGATGSGGHLTWDCSTAIAHWSMVASADGKSFSGSIDQWDITSGGEVHLLTTSFNVGR